MNDYSQESDFIIVKCNFLSDTTGACTIIILHLPTRISCFFFPL